MTAQREEESVRRGPAELVWADPAVLVVRANVRRERLTPDEDLVGSVRINGVVQPPVVYRDGDDLVLLAGHRRTAAAIAVGLDRIQVVVSDPPGGEFNRVALQVSENTNRAGLSVGDVTDAVEQLTLLGVPAGQIAAATGLGRRAAEAAGRVAAAGAGIRQRVTDTPGLTIEQAAAITEFAADEAAVERLLRAAGEGPVRFNHTHRDLTEARERATVVAAAVERWAAAGYQAFDSWPASKARAVWELLDADGQLLAGESREGRQPRHADCPDRAVVLAWADPGNDARVVEWCVDPKANGHRLAAHAGVSRGPGSLERTEVVANNRAWAAATTVRREHTAHVVHSGRMPGELVRALNLHLLAHRSLRTHGEVFDNLTGFGSSGVRPGALGPIIDTRITGNRAGAALLAAAAAAAEDTLGNTGWRTPSTTAADWLKLLVDHTGYQLSDIELLAVHKLDPKYQPPAADAAKTNTAKAAAAKTLRAAGKAVAKPSAPKVQTAGDAAKLAHTKATVSGGGRSR